MERTIPKRKVTPDRRVLRSRDLLRAALLDLLNDRAFDDITVRDIADRSGVGYTTFFRHYANKDALLDALIAAEIQNLTNRALPIYDADDGYGACLALCDHVAENRSLWSSLLTGGAAAKVREEMLVQSRRVTSSRETEGALPSELGTALAVAVILELLSWWLRQPAPWPSRKVAEILHSRVTAPST